MPDKNKMPLTDFSPPVRHWFEQNFDTPTPPQAQGWPAIQRRENTLILAPTGLGKTLAAFLWGIDRLYNQLSELSAAEVDKAGIRLLYISPLKALNNDVHRNLRTPLAGIRQAAKRLDLPFPDIRLAVRSGDTPSRERQAMLRKPPHILITTPESLYLMLTSPKAHALFETVETVIVDEIHTLAGNKRGVHLSLTLERLGQVAVEPVQRIGLSATIQPLNEVARFLGGQLPEVEPPTARPVTIINANAPKSLDLQVVSSVESFRDLGSDSIWPTLIPELLTLIDQHETTLIFCNSRRQAERTANRLNEQLMADLDGTDSPLMADGLPSGMGMMGSGTGENPAVIRAHHGSMSKEARLEMERDLKAGRLKALVATSSLELGIDIGSIDLVIQLQSPKGVAQGLQRVGRSGHLVGETTKGRLFPTHREDVVEAAAVAGGMLRGEVEPTYTPQNPLDVLAQQIVAMVSLESWGVDDLYRVVRQAYAYRNLTVEAFQSVLEMLAGRYPSQMHQQLRARLSWDRVNHRLAALPGSQLLALTNGGTISDKGMFAAYQAQSRTKLGDLDEEFIYESRVGDTFMLGSQVWRVSEITDDRVLVQPAPGATPRMPFWRGEYPWRDFSLGQRMGQFRRAVAERIRQLGANWADYYEIEQHRETAPVQALIAWLKTDFALDENSAWQVVDYVITHLESHDTISSDQTIITEIFPDSTGVPQMVVHSPFGGRVNGPWGLALAGAVREQTGVKVEVQSNDDGILLRLPDAEVAFPPDLVAQLGADAAREYLLRELPDSAVFGAQFRQNAARSLLLPGNRIGKRTPFWLQRLKAKDLMQVVRQFPDFPIMIETYRDCLETVMDLPHLENVLTAIEARQIQVLVTEPLSPSPLAIELMRQFIDIYLYEWDAPKAERQLQQLSINRNLLQDVLHDVNLGDLLKPEAIAAVSDQLQHRTDFGRARTADELAVMIEEMGDLTTAEILERSTIDPSPWLAQLTDQGRIQLFPVPTATGLEDRWISVHQADDYETAFAENLTDDASAEIVVARRTILGRYLNLVGPTTKPLILARYHFPEAWLEAELAQQVEAGQLTHGNFDSNSSESNQYLARHNLEQIHRRTLALLRREAEPVPRTIYADFLAHWQQVGRPVADEVTLVEVLQQLRGLPIQAVVWERAILPARLPGYRPGDLDRLCQQGEVVWVGAGGSTPRQSRVRLIFRGEGQAFLPALADTLETLSPQAQQLYNLLKTEGALFLRDITVGLRLTVSALQPTLLELIRAGLITNDSIDALRQMIDSWHPPTVSTAPRSSLESQLAARRSAPAVSGRLGRRPSRAKYQAAKRQVTARLQQPNPAMGEMTVKQGRWSVVHRLGVLGPALEPTARIAQQTRQLLQRWGVVTRETLAAEDGPWDWGEIYAHLSLMEMRGEVRRGYFVIGLPGLQFALPEAVERLRERRNAAPNPDHHPLILLNACDPANLYGPTLEDGPTTAAGEPLKFTRRPTNWLVQQRGYPVLVIENSGTRFTTTAGHSVELIQQAVDKWLDFMARFENRLSVQTWNDEPILSSEGRFILDKLGFRRDYPMMAWERHR